MDRLMNSFRHLVYTRNYRAIVDPGDLQRNETPVPSFK